MTDLSMGAASDRVEALLERLTRVELQIVVVAPPDSRRMAARERGRRAAVAAGRGTLLEEATGAARDITLRAFARGGFSGTWAATDMAASVTTAGDRVGAAAAFEEAAMAEVVEDLVDLETLETLRASSDELIRSTGMPSPGSLSTLTGSAAGVNTRGPLQAAFLTGFAILGVALWLALGPSVGLPVLAVGCIVAAWVARRRTEPQR